MDKNDEKDEEMCSILNRSPRFYGLTYFLLIIFFTGIYQCFPQALGTNNSILENLHFSITTITTLGYGDITPATNSGKITASIEVLLGIAVLGLFLNALSHKYADKINRAAKIREQGRKEELRKGLEMHACLPIEALKTGNPFIWDKHAKYAAPMSDLKDFTDKVVKDFTKPDFQIETLQIKALLESCHQNYETLAALSPIAADISPRHLLEWSSLLSNVRNLRDQYIKTTNEATEGTTPKWPTRADIKHQVEEYIQAAFFISESLET